MQDGATSNQSVNENDAIEINDTESPFENTSAMETLTKLGIMSFESAFKLPQKKTGISQDEYAKLEIIYQTIVDKVAPDPFGDFRWLFLFNARIIMELNNSLVALKEKDNDIHNLKQLVNDLKAEFVKNNLSRPKY